MPGSKDDFLIVDDEGDRVRLDLIEEEPGLFRLAMSPITSDGDNETLGSVSDAPEIDETNDASAISLLKGMVQLLGGNLARANSDEIIAGGSVQPIETKIIESSQQSKTIVQGTSGEKIRVLGVDISTNAAQRVTIQDGAGGDPIFGVFAEQDSAVTKDASGGYIGDTSDGNDLVFSQTDSKTTFVRVTYCTY